MEEWNLYTHNNITKTRKEIEKSRPLRSYVDTILRKSVDDLNFQFDKCNRAFHQRIDEYKEAKSKLENQHFEVGAYDNFAFLLEVISYLWSMGRYFV